MGGIRLGAPLLPDSQPRCIGQVCTANVLPLLTMAIPSSYRRQAAARHPKKVASKLEPQRQVTCRGLLVLSGPTRDDQGCTWWCGVE